LEKVLRLEVKRGFGGYNLTPNPKEGVEKAQKWKFK